MMTSQITPPFVVRPDCIVHSESGNTLPLVRIIGKIPALKSLAVVVEFDDAVPRRRWEELSWTEYRNWQKFSDKMMSYGYRCNNLKLLKLSHDHYMELDIQTIIRLLSASGWWEESKGERLYYIPTNTLIRRSHDLMILYKGSDGKPFQYGVDRSADIEPWNRELAPAFGRSPALMVAVLSGLGAKLFPAVKDLLSFCIFYGADGALDREVIRYAAACVFGAPHNASISSKSQTPLELAADFRHAVVCVDIQAHATNKQILSFFETLLGISGENRCASLPPDMHLIAFATGARSHLDTVPRSISVSAIVDPELKLYDSLPNFCTPEQMSALSRARQQKGGVGQKFVQLIERYSSPGFQRFTTNLIDQFMKKLQAKTMEEKSRARAVALFATRSW